MQISFSELNYVCHLLSELQAQQLLIHRLHKYINSVIPLAVETF